MIFSQQPRLNSMADTNNMAYKTSLFAQMLQSSVKERSFVLRFALACLSLISGLYEVGLSIPLLVQMPEAGLGERSVRHFRLSILPI